MAAGQEQCADTTMRLPRPPFGSKADLWRAAVDWAFRPLLEYLETADDESADPMIRLRMLIRNFIEYSATRPYLARIATVEGAAPTDRLKYLYRNYIRPVQRRSVPVFALLREQGRIKNIPTETFYFQLTSGGTAPFGQFGSCWRPARMVGHNAIRSMIPSRKTSAWNNTAPTWAVKVTNSKSATTIWHERNGSYIAMLDGAMRGRWIGP